MYHKVREKASTSQRESKYQSGREQVPVSERASTSQRESKYQSGREQVPVRERPTTCQRESKYLLTNWFAGLHHTSIKRVSLQCSCFRYKLNAVSTYHGRMWWHLINTNYKCNKQLGQVPGITTMWKCAFLLRGNIILCILRKFANSHNMYYFKLVYSDINTCILFI